MAAMSEDIRERTDALDAAETPHMLGKGSPWLSGPGVPWPCSAPTSPADISVKDSPSWTLRSVSYFPWVTYRGAVHFSTAGKFGIALCPLGPYDLAACSVCWYPPCCCSGVDRHGTQSA